MLILSAIIWVRWTGEPTNNARPRRAKIPLFRRQRQRLDGGAPPDDDGVLVAAAAEERGAVDTPNSTTQRHMAFICGQKEGG